MRRSCPTPLNAIVLCRQAPARRERMASRWSASESLDRVRATHPVTVIRALASPRRKRGLRTRPACA